MRRLLILTVFGAMLSGATGCRFLDCLWRGGPCQTPSAPTVTCPTTCPSPCASPCDPGAAATVPAITTPAPGSTTFAPGPAN